MNTDWTGIYTCKERHQTGSRLNHITTDHKEREQLEDQRNVGENSCSSVDGSDKLVQSLMYMIKMMMMIGRNSYFVIPEFQGFDYDPI